MLAYEDDGHCVSCGHDFNANEEHALAACPACGAGRPAAECKRAYRGDCEGEVEWRMNPRTWKPWGAMCEKHYRERLGDEEEANRKYGTYSSVPPEGFDPADAGENWGDDY